MAPITLHLRSECKPLEHRSALTPKTTKALLDAGFKVNIEHSPERIFKDEEFSAVGATLVPEGSWPSAPHDHLIVGLKELPEKEFPLHHTHIQFAHCYKQQSNWSSVLSRFPLGGGTLLDLEFLTDDSGRRVAAFGYHAGYAGAALAIIAWAWQLEHSPSEPMPGVSSYPNEKALLQDVRAAYKKGMELNVDNLPQVLVIGALGRCGKGAVDLCLAAGIPAEKLLKWDMAETAKGGPFLEIIESDIFVNCIYLSEPIPPFINAETLASPSRRLSVVCDVSCDTTNPRNPIPIYDVNTTFDKPTVPVKVTTEPPLTAISIDHLPSLLPREASEAFSAALLPSLLQLEKRHDSNVWKQAESLFKEKVGSLPDKLRRGKACLSGNAIPVAKP
ncbi:MAG: Saccharopine dehydrogenase [Icmadophila ericetorum]|nr:Saccharopine dehydrogenase [Icmadophila ericetorum]